MSYFKELSDKAIRNEFNLRREVSFNLKKEIMLIIISSIFVIISAYSLLQDNFKELDGVWIGLISAFIGAAALIYTTILSVRLKNEKEKEQNFKKIKKQYKDHRMNLVQLYYFISKMHNHLSDSMSYKSFDLNDQSNIDMTFKDVKNRVSNINEDSSKNIENDILSNGLHIFYTVILKNWSTFEKTYNKYIANEKIDNKLQAEYNESFNEFYIALQLLGTSISAFNKSEYLQEE